MRFIRRRPLMVFFGLTFGIAWGVPGLALAMAAATGAFEPELGEFTPLSYVSLWAPAAAAFIVVGSLHGWHGVSAYARHVVRPMGSLRWYVAVVIVVATVNLLAAVLLEVTGHEALTWPPELAIGAFLALVLLRATEGPMEELGWRGFALPLLQRRLGGLGASVMLGMIWALWHLPALVVGRPVGGGVSGSLAASFAIFTLGLIAVSILTTVVFNATAGSVPIAFLFHWMTNLPYPWESGLDLSRAAVPLWVGVALLVGLTVGRRYLGRTLVVTRVGDGSLLPSHEDLLFISAGDAREAGLFSPDRVADMPEPARRYLRHAIAPGTPLARIVRLEMDGSMLPRPGGPRVGLTAEEVLAPHVGFTWTARARMFGLPVSVRDHYFENEGGVSVDILGVIPVVRESGADVTRSSRGRLVAEAVWCPTALVGPDVRWEAIDADRARFTLTVDGDSIPVTIRVGRDGALREVTLERWGTVDVPSARPIPYGFEVLDSASFGGVTIPARLRGGWWYGTDRFDPDTGAEFVIRAANFWPVPTARATLVER